MKHKRKRIPKNQNLLSMVDTDISESKAIECPYKKYAEKYFSAIGDNTEYNVNLLSEGLKEILTNDGINYKIKINYDDSPENIIEKFIPNMPCPVTRKYLKEIINKLKKDETLTKVEDQVKNHIIKETRKFSDKPVPKIGDNVITDKGDKGVVTERKGLNFTIKTGDSYITENFKNIISIKNDKKEIKEYKQLSKFFESFNFDRQIVNELFTDESDVEIVKSSGLDRYIFEIDGIDYCVIVSGKEILFASIDKNDNSNYEPVNNNKNQFLVMNTVISCIRDILNSNKKYYYFTGNTKNGLARLYSVMFNKLKDEAVSMGYVAIDLNSEDRLREAIFCFYPKHEFTMELYECIIKDYPSAKIYGFDFAESSYNNKRIVNELFTDESDVEIVKSSYGDKYSFEIDGQEYFIWVDMSEIVFANIDKNNHSNYEPSKNNKNQFLVMNTVVSCVRDILKSNKKYYYFTSNTKNGLTRLYSVMFNKLKNEAVAMGYVAIDLNSEDRLREAEFCFIPKQGFTMELYESIIKDYPSAKIYGFDVTESRYNNKQIVNELFTDESDVEIVKSSDGKNYDFEIDGEEYLVKLSGPEIMFGHRAETGEYIAKPSKNNKNQFLVMNTVVSCVRDILKSNKKYYYFTGDASNGLARLYSVMFNKLKNEAVSMGYVAIDLNSEDRLREAEFCFIPHQEFTVAKYGSLIEEYPSAKFYGFDVPEYYIPAPKNNIFDVEEIYDDEFLFLPRENTKCMLRFTSEDDNGKNYYDIEIKTNDLNVLKNNSVINTYVTIILTKMKDDHFNYVIYANSPEIITIADIICNKIEDEYIVTKEKQGSNVLYSFSTGEDEDYYNDYYDDEDEDE